MRIGRRLLLGLIGVVAWTTCQAEDFNSYVFKAVKKLHAEHANGGYDLGHAFTHNIDYGGQGVIKASSPNKTMCVAAVSEVIIYATKLYAEETGDKSVFSKIPLKAWVSGNLTSLRANIFMFKEAGSRGTGGTLATYQLGDQMQFPTLKGGDFINLNRTNGTGHAVVFLSYIDKGLNETEKYAADNIVGFRYFSAQGGADNGFGFRNAYFSGICPDKPGVRKDCGIIRSTNPVLLNTGRMWSPDKWNYLAAVEAKKQQTKSILEGANEGASKGTIDMMLDQLLSKELKWTEDEAKFFANNLPD